MGKIRNWLIRRLGGFTQSEVDMKDLKIALLSRCDAGTHPLFVREKFFIRPDQDKNEMNRRFKRYLAELLGVKMLELNLIDFEKHLMPIQPNGPVSAYWMKATAWVHGWRYRFDLTGKSAETSITDENPSAAKAKGGDDDELSAPDAQDHAAH